MMELRNDVNVNIGLMLTPDIDLSLRMLAMNVVELEEKLKELAEENPIVNIDDDMGIQKHTAKNESKLKEISESFKEKFSNDEGINILEVTVADNETLAQSLARQIRFEADLDEVDEKIVSFIIYNLNDKGFLDIRVQDIVDKFDKPENHVEKLRRKIMFLEPIGCGSLNMVEFLKLQSEIYGSADADNLNRLIDVLYAASKPNIGKIKDKLGVNDELFKVLFEELSNFSLYPLENYAVFDNRIYIEPDVYIKKVGGRYIAVLNEKNLSRIHVDENLFKEYINDEDAKEFLKEKYKQAKQFMLAIARRNKTVLKTVNIIIEKQERFFKEGILMPLTRKDISEDLGYNVSTITRAVSNKYVEYEGKMIPLKNFFSFGVNENLSKDFIKNTIKRFLKEEDEHNPLNDSAIQSMLEKHGISVTRRTITKYRKEMNIPNSRLRKCQTI